MAQSTRPITATSDSLQAQILALGERMEQGFKRIEEKIDDYEARVRAVENIEAGFQPLVQARLASVERHVGDHEKSMQLTQTAITELKQVVKLLAWIGSIVGSAVILWIIGQVLGLVK